MNAARQNRTAWRRGLSLLCGLAGTLWLSACGKVPPPEPGELVFTPSGREYPENDRFPGPPPPSADMRHVLIEARTVRDAAQVYADFAGKEVRVPETLGARPLPMGQSSTARGYVVASLTDELFHAGVAINRLGGNVVAFRARAADASSEMTRPPRATPEQATAARAALSEARFWEIIEAARTKRRTNSDGDCLRQAAALERQLRSLPPEAVQGFDLRFQEAMLKAYRWDLWAVAYIINGGASDDGFTYFRAWLVMQGRQNFEAAMTQAERAADSAGTDYQNECEAVMYVAGDVYQAKTGRVLPYWPLDYSPEPKGKRWSEDEVDKLYPALSRKF